MLDNVALQPWPSSAIGLDGAMVRNIGCPHEPLGLKTVLFPQPLKYPWPDLFLQNKHATCGRGISDCSVPQIVRRGA